MKLENDWQKLSTVFIIIINFIALYINFEVFFGLFWKRKKSLYCNVYTVTPVTITLLSGQ